MAVTTTKVKSFNVGELFLNVVEVDFDSSYPTGGEPLSGADLGFDGDPELVVPLNRSGYTFEYDRTNKKLIAYVEEAVAAGGPLLEVANATNLSTLVDVVVLAFGRIRK